MNPLKFDARKEGDLFTYHFHPKKSERIIGKEEGFSANETLWQNWLKNNNLPEIFRRYNIGAFSVGENILLYILIIYELAGKQILLGTGIDETEFTGIKLNRNPKLIKWEYHLEHIGEVIRRIGFVRPKSPLIDKNLNHIHPYKINIFHLDYFGALADFLKPGFDACYHLSNFYITENNKHIINPLADDRKPELEHLLTNKDIFIGLFIGEDEGFHDYFFIASKIDLSGKLTQISRKINDFAKYYIHRIQTLRTTKEMIKTIEKGLNDFDLNIY
ncbi:MAG: hypothetical protein GXO24_06145 [Chlorobi bacterium]|nr:hypothetical protein [Chlorobiota bacterium]